MGKVGGISDIVEEVLEYQPNLTCTCNYAGRRSSGVENSTLGTIP